MIQGAAVILITTDKKVLLNHRDSNPKFYKNLWSLIGGAIEEGESPEVTASRELFEETAYKANNLNLLFKGEYDHESGEKATRYIYWCEYDGKQEIQCNEGLEMKFVTIEEINKLDLITGQKEIIKLALEEYSKKNNNQKI